MNGETPKLFNVEQVVQTPSGSVPPSPILQNETPKSKAHRIFVYGVFLFVIIVILFLGILNYSNIIPISNFFPNQLGWLPHKTQQDTSTNTKKFPSFPRLTPSESPTIFQYDIEKAKIAVTKYIKDNINSDFLPPNIDVKQNLISNNTLTGTNYTFGAYWKLKDITFNANLHYISGSNEIRDMEFFIAPKDANISSIDSKSSEALTQTYLNNINENQLNFDCGTFKETTNFCEHFTINDTGKKGFGIVKSKDSKNNNILSVFSCFIPKNNSYYDKRTSCLLFREEKPEGL